MKIAIAVTLIICGSALVALPFLAAMLHMPHLQADSIVCIIFGMSMVMWGAFDVPAIETGDADEKQAIDA
jgi:hypothetical protein